MTAEEFLRQAQPDCPSCHGSGIIEGEVIPEVTTSSGEVVAWSRNPDRVCYCVPVMIIRAADA